MATTIPPQAPNPSVPADPGTVERVSIPRLSHTAALILAGVAFYVLMGLFFIFEAITHGQIHIPAGALPYVMAIAPTVPLFFAWILKGLKTGDWDIEDAFTELARRGEMVYRTV